MAYKSTLFSFLVSFILVLFLQPADLQGQESTSIYLKRFVKYSNGDPLENAPPQVTFTTYLNGEEDSVLIETAPRLSESGKNVNTTHGMVGVELSLLSHISAPDTAFIRVTDDVRDERGTIRQPIDTIPWTDPNPLKVLHLSKTDPPPRPRNITIDSGHGNTITWDAKDGLTYQVYRSNLQKRLANFKIHKLFVRQADGISKGSWTDPDTTAGSNYSYLVYAVDSSGVKSAHSREVFPSKPNILLINVDDLGSRDLSFMGSEFYETPNIDSLAASGMVFSNAYAAASNCSPSRASLMTGQYTPRTGVYTVNSSFRGDEEDRKVVPVANDKFIDSEDYTIAEELQQFGYLTAHIGKWHISRDPTYHGFDLNIGGLQAGRPNWGNMGGYFAPYNNPNLEEGPKGEYLTDRLTDEAISVIDTAGNQPFFINFATYAVHQPIQPKPKLKTKYQQKEGTAAHNNPGYAAMIETLDRNVGRLIDHLKAAGEYDNTLILFTSDHGGVFYITKMWPLRSGKGSYYDGGIRVPLIAVWPDHIEAGSRSEQVVSQIDFFPTILDAANIQPPSGKILDGTSLVPAFKGNSLKDRAVYWHFPIYIDRGNAESISPQWRTTPGSAIRKNQWKLHQYFEDGHLELYNIEKDPGEQNNLVDEKPQKAADLYQQLKDWRARVNAPLPGKSTDIPGTRNGTKPDFRLEKNYPNPFNPTTTISFTLPNSSYVRIEVFNPLGRHIRTLVNRKMSRGTHQTRFNGSGLSSGIYMYKLKTPSVTQTRKMLLLK